MADDVVIMQRLQHDSSQAAHAAQESQRHAQASKVAAAGSVRQAAAHRLAAGQAAEMAADYAQTAQDSQRHAQRSEMAAAESEQRTADHRLAAEQSAEVAAVHAAEEAAARVAEVVHNDSERADVAKKQAESAARNADQYAQQAGIKAQNAQAAADVSQEAIQVTRQARDDTARYAAEVQGYTQQAVLSAQQIKEDTDTGLLVAQDIAQQVAVVNMAVSRVVEDASYVEQAVIRTLDKAPVDSPVFTGTPQAPTPDGSAVGQEIATAAFVLAQVSKLINSSPAAMDTLQELASALGNDPEFSATVMNLIGQKLDKLQNGADIPDKSRFLQNIGVVSATISRRGIVQLSDSTESTSISEAATANALRRTYQYATRIATTNQIGQVQLEDRINAGSTTRAATSDALTRTYQSATRIATTSQMGQVQLSDSTSSTSISEAATANAVRRAYESATRIATTSQMGQVKLNDSTNSDSTTEAATASAVRRVSDRVNKAAVGHKTLLFSGNIGNGNISLSQNPSDFDEIIIVSTDDNNWYAAIDIKPMWVINEIVNRNLSVDISIRSIDGSIWTIPTSAFRSTLWVVSDENSRIHLIYGVKYT
ncbi:tail fiber protein [Edwardsiella ictaluri]|uniref:tail fiber protein n=1 Tax=Edwardsiella ictaluri TaxID=67780 RepID=UPI0036D3E508